MMDRPIAPQLLGQLRELAIQSSVPMSEMSMQTMADALGIARMTLYRRAGRRENIVSALREQGVDAARPPDAADRVLGAVVDLLREKPLASISIETIAERANCSVPAIYDRFGNRQGLLVALLERHSPLIPLQRAISADEIARPGRELRQDVHLLYSTIFYAMQSEWSLVRSFIAELLAGPDTDLAKVVRDWYVPQMMAIVAPILARHLENGAIRDMPLPIVFQFLAGPMSLHIASRTYVMGEMGIALPDSEKTIDLFTDVFCRAVGREG